MTIPTFSWPGANEFHNRVEDISTMETWWAAPTRDALCLLGRRRVGKSWLFRRFAHGKPAVILVADRLLLSTQMARFAGELEPLFDIPPALADLAALIRALYRLGKTEKVLVVIDEFPYLLPDGPEREQVLTQLQAVMETERDQSQTKLMLCGSIISQMETLLAQSTPISGRLRKFDVWPMTLSEARDLMPGAKTADQRITRYALAGGMARHLAELGGDTDLQRTVCERVLDRRGPLFDDPRSVLMQELRNPAIYFSILQLLALHSAAMDHLTSTLQLTATQLTPYLETLREMRLVSALQPVGAPAKGRSRKYQVDDGFIRFWFRFVFPHQDNLSSGLRPRDLWSSDVQPHLADHTSPTFEDLCQRWTRLEYGDRFSSVGAWWGPALHSERRAKRRLSEEVDVVAAQRGRLGVVGECKWTTGVMGKKVLDDLKDFKLPAIDQEGRISQQRDPVQILLFARSGFARELTTTAAENPNVRLITADEVVAGLDDAVV